MNESERDIGQEILDAVREIKEGGGRQFDATLLEGFTNQFYGYGNYEGDYWFVGMEEGGGSSFASVERRLNVWNERGRRELEDVAGYHVALGITSLFSERPKIQPTWGRLIRVVLAMKGDLPTANQIRDYQRDCLGRMDGDTCLLELLPLPSPSTRRWIYGDHSQLPYLVDRDSYRRTLLDGRIKHLQQRIDQHCPKVILFYSFSYREHWQAIAGVDFLSVEEGAFYIGSNSLPVFVITKHPAATGLSNHYWHRVGHVIASKLDAQI